MKTAVVLTISCLFSCLQLFAQPVTAVADRDSILIGEKIQLQLKAFYAPGQQPVWFDIDTIPHFEIMERQPVDTQRYNQDLILKQTLILTSWDSGTWFIPALKLPQGNTEALQIYVGHTPFDYSQPYNPIHDIREVEEKKPGPNWFWWALIALVLIALYLVFFPPKKEEEAPAVIDPGAYQKAMARLRELQAKDYQQQDTKVFFSELIRIFRDYLQGGKGLVSHSRTTTDLSVQLKGFGLPQDQYASLVQALRLGDLVKFARYRASAGEADKALDEIAGAIKSIEQKDAV